MKYENPNNHWKADGDYRDDENYEASMKIAVASFLSATVSIIIGCIVAFIISCLMSSCTTKVVTVPEYHTEYVTRVDTFVQRDSIHTKDSILIQQKGDTVFIDRWHTLYKDRWRDRVRVDSFIRTDSVRVPYPVERKLSKWQQAKIDMGGWMVGIIIAGVVALCVWLIRKKKII